MFAELAGVNLFYYEECARLYEAGITVKSQVIDNCLYITRTEVKYNIGNDTLMSDAGIVPIGRSIFEPSQYGLFSCYCHNPVNMYSFLIDEIGEVYKCSFGVWNYTCLELY